MIGKRPPLLGLSCAAGKLDTLSFCVFWIELGRHLRIWDDYLRFSASHAKNSNAANTGLPYSCALRALPDCVPASAVTSTSHRVFVTDLTGLNPASSASCSISQRSTICPALSCAVPVKQIRTPGASTDPMSLPSKHIDSWMISTPSSSDAACSR